MEGTAGDREGRGKGGSWPWGRTGAGGGVGLGSTGGEWAQDGTHSRVHQRPDERAGDGLGVPVSPAPRMCPPGCSVDDNGVEFPVGQLWSPGDPCELCICQVNENLLCFTPPPRPWHPPTPHGSGPPAPAAGTTWGGHGGWRLGLPGSMGSPPPAPCFGVGGWGDG